MRGPRPRVANNPQIDIFSRTLRQSGSRWYGRFVLEFLTIGVMGRAGVEDLSGAREIRHEGPQAMQGAPKRQVNAEEMLAELKRALESSTGAPDASSPAAPTGSKSGSSGREIRRAQIDKRSDP